MSSSISFCDAKLPLKKIFYSFVMGNAFFYAIGISISTADFVDLSYGCDELKLKARQSKM